MNLLFLQFDGCVNEEVSTGYSRMANGVLVVAYCERIAIVVRSVGASA